MFSLTFFVFLLFGHTSETCNLVNILMLFLVFSCEHFDHSLPVNKVYTRYGCVTYLIKCVQFIDVHPLKQVD